jgi:hypothetical protein
MSFFSCKDEDSTITHTNYDCDFVQDDDAMERVIDDTERALMEDCRENRITSKVEVEANLIGEWQLIGHGEGWLPSKSQPCGYITITENKLIFEFKNAYIDTITTHTWEIIEYPNGTLALNISPEYIDGLGLNIFCSDYIYGDATPLDGNMYLYQKVN